MILILLRHGVTKTNLNKLIQGRENHPLSPEGIIQAQKIAKIIKDEIPEINAFYTSPLKRAIQTLEIVESLYNEKHYKVIEGLLERDFGPYENKPVNKMPWDGTPLPGFETNKELEKRVTDTIFNLYKIHNNEIILCTCHSHTIKGFLASTINFNYRDRIENCEAVILEVKNNNVKMLKRLK